MTELSCSVCHTDCFFKPRPKEDEQFGAKCDGCKLAVCRACAGIVTTEAHAVALASRRILFYCPSCRDTLIDLAGFQKLFQQLDKTKSECKRKDNYIAKLKDDYDVKVGELEAKLTNVTKDNSDLNKYMNRLKGRTLDIEDEVLTTVQVDTDGIKQLKEEKKRLNDEILALLDKNENLLKDLESLQEKNNSLSEDLSELRALQQNFLTSIDTLTNDNKVYASDLKKSALEVFRLKEELTAYKVLDCHNDSLTTHRSLNLNSQTVNSEPLTPTITPTKPAQILVVGNKSCAMGMGVLIKKYLSRDIDINCQYKNQALFEELVDTLTLYSRNFTKDDFILFFTGKENAIRGLNISDSSLVKLSMVTKKTNLIVIAPPFASDRPILNGFIYDQNLTIYRNVSDNNHKSLFLSLDTYTAVSDRNRYANTCYSAKTRCIAFISGQIRRWFSQSYKLKNSGSGDDPSIDVLHTDQENTSKNDYHHRHLQR